MGFLNNVIIKHCVRLKLKPSRLKNSKILKMSKDLKKRRRFDVYSMSFSSQNEWEKGHLNINYIHCTKNESLESKMKHC